MFANDEIGNFVSAADSAKDAPGRRGASSPSLDSVSTGARRKTYTVLAQACTAQRAPCARDCMGLRAGNKRERHFCGQGGEQHRTRGTASTSGHLGGPFAEEERREDVTKTPEEGTRGEYD